jgi:hypothetical protein
MAAVAKKAAGKTRPTPKIFLKNISAIATHPLNAKAAHVNPLMPLHSNASVRSMKLHLLSRV